MPLKCKFLKLSSAPIKILEIPHSLYFFIWNCIYFLQKEPIKVHIWWNFTWAVESLKFCTLMGFVRPNHIKSQLKKCRRVISHDAEEDAKFKEKLTSGFKYDMRNRVNFHPIHQKSENFTSVGLFCPKYLGFEIKIYRGIIFHDTEQWCKIWINPDLATLCKTGMRNWELNFH